MDQLEAFNQFKKLVPGKKYYSISISKNTEGPLTYYASFAESSTLHNHLDCVKFEAASYEEVLHKAHSYILAQNTEIE